MESQTTRQRLLAAATALMRRSGLSGAGINEIVRESGAPKGSVYYFFPDGKQQIVSEALVLYAGTVAEFIERTLASRRAPGKKVQALFEAYAQRLAKGHFSHSCPSGTVCLDLDSEMEALRLVVAGTFDQYIDAIARHFDFGSSSRSRSFAGLVLTAIEGAYIRGRASKSSDPFLEAGAWLARLADAAARGSARP